MAAKLLVFGQEPACCSECLVYGFPYCGSAGTLQSAYFTKCVEDWQKTSLLIKIIKAGKSVVQVRALFPVRGAELW